MTVDDHVQAWSRVDYLLDRNKKGLRSFMNAFKDPTHRAKLSGVATSQEVALHEAWGLDPEAFDKAWVAWVKRKY